MHALADRPLVRPTSLSLSMGHRRGRLPHRGRTDRAAANGGTQIRRAHDNKNIDKAKGRVKQAAGSLSGNKRMKNEGRVEEAKGSVKTRGTRSPTPSRPQRKQQADLDMREPTQLRLGR